MKAIREDTSEIAEIERRLAGSIPADPELRDRLEARDKYRRTHLQLLHDAKENGKAEGRMEQRREMAKKMKNGGLPIADIAAYTGLPEDEIRAL